MLQEPFCEAAKTFGYSWPSLRWWLSLTASDQGAWFAGLGAFFAAGVALWFGFSQQRQERRASEAVRVAVANALITDLRTAKEYFRSGAFWWSVAQESAETARQSIGLLSSLKLPSFESFHELLPRLGGDVAPAVIEAYCCVLRVTSLAAGHHASEQGSEHDIEFLRKLITSIPNAIARISRAEDALKPYYVSW